MGVGGGACRAGAQSSSPRSSGFVIRGSDSEEPPCVCAPTSSKLLSAGTAWSLLPHSSATGYPRGRRSGPDGWGLRVPWAPPRLTAPSRPVLPPRPASAAAAGARHLPELACGTRGKSRTCHHRLQCRNVSASLGTSMPPVLSGAGKGLLRWWPGSRLPPARLCSGCQGCFRTLAGTLRWHRRTLFLGVRWSPDSVGGLRMVRTQQPLLSPRDAEVWSSPLLCPLPCGRGLQCPLPREPGRVQC